MAKKKVRKAVWRVLSVLFMAEKAVKKQGRTQYDD